MFVLLGNSYNIYTSDSYNGAYTNWFQPVHGDRWLSFRVKTCSDASFALMLQESEDEFVVEFEIVFGGENNMQTFIRKQGETVESAETPNILDCGTFRELWVKWQGDLVEAGTGGHIGSNRVIHYEDTDPRGVDVVGVNTGSGQYGEWEFHVYSSKCPIKKSSN